MKQKLLNSIRLRAMMLVAVMCAAFAGQAWADDVTLTASSGFSSSYSSNRTSTMAGVGFKDSGVMYNGKNQPTGFAVKQVIQMRKSGSGAGEIYNTSAISTITSLEVTLVNNNNGFTLYYGTTENPSTNSIASSSLTPVTGTFSYTDTNSKTASATSYKFTFDLSSYDPTYIKIVNGSSANYVGSIVINYEEAAPTQVSTPTFSPAAGAVAYNTSVSINCATDGATIHYTTNGTDPTSSSPTYSSPISITAATTIKAIAIKDGLTDSEIGTAAYTIAPPAAPTFDVSSGTIPVGTKVTITGSGTIRYTTNGTDPTSSTGTVYSEPVEINSSCTLKAICVDGGGNTSSVTSANYGVITPVAGYTIDFETAPAAYTDWTMTNVVQGTGSITAHGGTYYGTTGGKASASIVTAAKVAKPETLTFYVSKTTSNTTTSTWYVEVSSDGSDWDEIITQDAKSMTAGSWTKVQCDIVDGSDDPYEDVYIRIRYEGSNAVRTIDDITLTEVMAVAAPVFSVEAGTYTSVQNVGITCATGGATIYYTTDGTNPTSSSTVYSSAVSISESCTLKAIAIKGDDESNITSAAYTINLPKDYNLATTITSGKHYVIASGADDGSVNVMNTQNANNRGVLGATVSSTVLTASGAVEFVIYGPDADGLYTIYDASANGYLYAASSSSNHLKTQAGIDDNARWEITFDDEEDFASIVAVNSKNNKVMQYNSSSTLFSCYGSASQSDVYLYEKDGEATPTESVTVGAAGYTTYTTMNPVSSFPDGVTAYIATAVNPSTIHLEEVPNAPARTPLVIKAAAKSYTLTSGTSTADVSSNILKSSNGSVTGNGTSIYALGVGKTGVNEGVVGFYLVNSGQTIPAGKAYLNTAGGGAVKEFLTFDFDDATAIAKIQDSGSKIQDSEIFNLAGQKMSKLQKGVNIVNGKKVLVK